MKKLKVEIALDENSGKIATAIIKEGFEAGISGDLEIIGLLENLKGSFLPKIEEEKRKKL